MWSDWLLFCDYGFSVSALWCPLTTPTISLGFLLPRTWDISSWLLQQSAAAAPCLEQGHPSWTWTWSSSSQPFYAHAAAAHVVPEVRGSTWEELPHIRGQGWWLRWVTPCPEEAQAGIKISGGHINNLRYADDTTLMAESEEELKSLLMKVKEESEKLA